MFEDLGIKILSEFPVSPKLYMCRGVNMNQEELYINSGLKCTLLLLVVVTWSHCLRKIVIRSHEPCVNSELISLRVLNYGAKNPINTKSSIFFTALIYFTMIVVFTAVSYKVPFRKWENQALKKMWKQRWKWHARIAQK